MASAPVTRRSAISAFGLVALSLSLMLGCGPSQTPSPVGQPHMRAALDALQDAKRHLDLALADKGGHRVKAIELVNQAIAETQAGIDFAATH